MAGRRLAHTPRTQRKRPVRMIRAGRGEHAANDSGGFLLPRRLRARHASPTREAVVTMDVVSLALEWHDERRLVDEDGLVNRHEAECPWGQVHGGGGVQ
jgi:hypothetical protein